MFKLDQLVWAVRRHCRPFHTVDEFDGKQHEIHWVQLLKQNPRIWRWVGENRVIEKTLDGKVLTDVKRALTTFNFPFAPNESEKIGQLTWASAESPLTNWLMLMENKKTNEETRTISRLVLEWVQANIHLPKEAEAEISEVLKKQRR